MILRNNFHNTEYRINLRGDTISSHQIRRAVRALCNSNTCTCGGIRGPQEYKGERVALEQIRPNEWRVVPD